MGTPKVPLEGLHLGFSFFCSLMGGCRGCLVAFGWISGDPSVKWFQATIVGIYFSITITQSSGWGLPQISGGGEGG